MQAAQVLAGYILGEADLLRRAMGKKIKAEMDAQRAALRRGLRRANDIGAAKANELFDLIDKFAGYGFNKSHAAAYALVAYQTAWLKAHHPAEFFAASMCFDMAQTDKLAHLRRRHAPAGRRVPAAVTINASEAEFSVERRRGLPSAMRSARSRASARRRWRRWSPSARRNGAVRQPRRFRRADRSAAAQPPPARKPGRRRARSMCIDPTAPGVYAGRRNASSPIAASAARPADERPGRPVRRGRYRCRADPPAARPSAGRWPSAWRAESEAFGFYFSAHPVEQYRHLVAAHGARTYRRAVPRCRDVADGAPHRRDDGRAGRGSALAHLGARPALHDGDPVRPHPASSSRAASTSRSRKILEDAARDGGCALLTVELDRRPGEETPRVTVRVAPAARRKLAATASAADRVPRSHCRARSRTWRRLRRTARRARGASLLASTGDRSTAWRSSDHARPRLRARSPSSSQALESVRRRHGRQTCRCRRRRDCRGARTPS